MIGEVGLTNGKEAGNCGHEFIVDPQPAHCIMTRGVDLHWFFIRINCGNGPVHLEQVAVLILYHLLSLFFYGIAEVEVDGKTGLSDPYPASHLSLAALEATSRGTRLPKVGYRRSR